VRKMPLPVLEQKEMLTDKIKRSASRRIYYLVATKRLKRSTVCCKCKKKFSYSLTGHHHRGYKGKNRDNVVWVCLSCHMKIHWKMNTYKKTIRKRRDKK
jgi:hypothetical protein